MKALHKAALIGVAPRALLHSRVVPAHQPGMPDQVVTEFATRATAWQMR